MSDHNKLQQLADNAFFRLATQVVSAVAIPLFLWGLGVVRDELASINRSIGAFTTQAATTELRLQQVERTQTELAAAIRSLQGETAQHGFEIRRLEERTSTGRRP